MLTGQSIKKTFLAGLLFILLKLNAFDNIIKYPIDLSVYDGENSILLKWKIHKSIEIKTTKIYSRNFSQKEFELISSTSLDENKYLDTNCVSNSRYFYKVEIQDSKNREYSSDEITPPFGNCISLSNDNYFRHHIKSMNGLIMSHLRSKMDKEFKSNNNAELFKILELNPQSKYSWIEFFPLIKLKEVKPLVNILNNIIEDENIHEEIAKYRMFYGNRFFISPDSWDNRVKEELQHLRDSWELLFSLYDKNIEAFENLQPVRIIGSEKLNDDKILFRLCFFHFDKIKSNEIFILSGKEYINVQVNKESGNNHLEVDLPIQWKNVKLMMGDSLIQTCSILSESVVYTLNDEIIVKPKDKISQKEIIKFESDKSGIYINEVSWNPFRKLLALEITGSTLEDHEFFISDGISFIWELNFSPDESIGFADTTLTFSDDLILPFSISLNKSYNGNLLNIEQIHLDTIPFSISRLSDTGKWEDSYFDTFGQSNSTLSFDETKNVIPQFFVLYQNYPNPFNGQTKISFDILEDALVSLYIIDAKGRIHDKILKEEYITKGNYNYNWSGEGRSTGIYFITLQAKTRDFPAATYSRKMIYLK